MCDAENEHCVVEVKGRRPEEKRREEKMAAKGFLPDLLLDFILSVQNSRVDQARV